MYNSNHPISSYFEFVAKLKEVNTEGGKQNEKTITKDQKDVKAIKK